jgi:hypothetical protein
MLLQSKPGVYILPKRHSFDNQYGIKTQLLHTYLPLFALRLFFVCAFHFIPRFSKNICVYDRCVRASRPDITKKFEALLKTRKYWSCYNATWLIGSIVAAPL